MVLLANHLKKIISNKSGQGILETVIALGVIITALSGGMGLAIKSLTSSQQSQMSVIASNLAREGIEIVRNIRDRNWLEEGTWDADLSLGADTEAIVTFDPASDPVEWNIDFSSPAYPACKASNKCRLFKGTGDYQDVYAHISSAGWEETQFYRVISLKQICKNGQILNNCGGGNPKIGIQAVSSVYWEERGNEHSLDIEEQIYNWR